VCAASSAGRFVCLQLMWEVGLPPSPVGFFSLHHSHKLSCSWLLGVHPRSHPLWPGPACLFTVLGGIPFPPLQSSVCPTLFAMCLYCSYCLLLSFFFSLGPGGLCWSGLGLSVGALRTA
jgi:hypothetical protein